MPDPSEVPFAKAATFWYQGLTPPGHAGAASSFSAGLTFIGSPSSMKLSSISQGTGCWACTCKTWESNVLSPQKLIVQFVSGSCAQKWLLVSQRIMACTQPHDWTFISVWMYIQRKMFTWKFPKAKPSFHQHANQGCLSWQKKWQAGCVSGPPWSVPPLLLASTSLPFLQMNLPQLAEHHTQHTDSGKLLPDFVMLQWMQSDGHQLFKIHFCKHIFTNVDNSLRMYRHGSVFPPLRDKLSVPMQSKQCLVW